VRISRRILVTALADTFLTHMPEEIVAETAGFGNPSYGDEDIIGNGSCYYLFVGATENEAVAVELLTCLYSGHLAITLYIYDR
ncbi:MAG: hypothetical protein II721_03605, partial [Bacilli bacterium]|nr:hypothetical protein [Bacilli bacterium]